jgi:hypothetical protein
MRLPSVRKHIPLRMYALLSLIWHAMRTSPFFNDGVC